MRDAGADHCTILTTTTRFFFGVPEFLPTVSHDFCYLASSFATIALRSSSSLPTNTLRSSSSSSLPTTPLLAVDDHYSLLPFADDITTSTTSSHRCRDLPLSPSGPSDLLPRRRCVSPRLRSPSGMISRGVEPGNWEGRMGRRGNGLARINAGLVWTTGPRRVWRRSTSRSCGYFFAWVRLFRVYGLCGRRSGLRGEGYPINCARRHGHQRRVVFASCVS